MTEKFLSMILVGVMILLDGLSVRDDDVDGAAGAVSEWPDGLAITQ